jgi:hypothetical protein
MAKRQNMLRLERGESFVGKRLVLSEKPHLSVGGSAEGRVSVSVRRTRKDHTRVSMKGGQPVKLRARFARKDHTRVSMKGSSGACSCLGLA